MHLTESSNVAFAGLACTTLGKNPIEMTAMASRAAPKISPFVIGMHCLAITGRYDTCNASLSTLFSFFKAFSTLGRLPYPEPGAARDEEDITS